VQWPAVLAFVLGSAITVGLASFVHVRDRERQQVEFERRGHVLLADLRTRLELPVEALQSVAAFYDASHEVSREEFGRFVKDALRRHPSIRALEWIPIVPGTERATYVARARADGIPDFEFKEEGPGLELVIAGRRAEYLPIYYMEPPDRTALGFDVAASAFRRAPADRAREKGGSVASERIRLVEDPPDVYSIAVFHPVRSTETLGDTQGVRGYVAEVFRLKPLVGPIFEAAIAQGDSVALIDTGAPPELRTLFVSPTVPGGESRGRRSTPYTATFPFAERTWSLTLTAGPARERAMSAWPLGILGSGLVTSTLFSLTLSATMLIFRLQRDMHAARRLGQYTLVEKIGAGGMGVVYRAQHWMLRRATAVKLLLPGEHAREDIERFEREVQLTSQLAHPNTIAVYDYGRTRDGIFYYAMEFIEGLALDDLVRKDGPMPAARVVRIMLQVCGALDEAHARGIVHRDIKPANLMLMERGGIPDFVKVLDFGLVKENSSDVSLGLSRGTLLLGTPLYMSPEAILSGVVDGRSDLYALGAVAYYLLTGTTVFQGESVVEVCAQHLSSAPMPPSQRTDRFVPPSLDALLLRCLEKQPENRPATAGALAKELRAIEAEIGAFTDDEAHLWWAERGRKLMAELRSSRRAPVRGEDGGHVTLAVAPRVPSG
jgi:serine/threonine-protein kinase